MADSYSPATLCCFTVDGACFERATERFVPDEGFPVQLCRTHADHYVFFMGRMASNRRPRGYWEVIPAAAVPTPAESSA